MRRCPIGTEDVPISITPSTGSSTMAPLSSSVRTRQPIAGIHPLTMKPAQCRLKAKEVAYLKDGGRSGGAGCRRVRRSIGYCLPSILRWLARALASAALAKSEVNRRSRAQFQADLGTAHLCHRPAQDCGARRLASRSGSSRTPARCGNDGTMSISACTALESLRCTTCRIPC
jgi:hypothetical protein